MEKTTVYLTADQRAALRRAALAQQRSEATLIRAGVDAVTAGHRTGDAPAGVLAAADDPAPAPPRRPRWVDREFFASLFLDRQADPALAADLRDLAPETTDDLPYR